VVTNFRKQVGIIYLVGLSLENLVSGRGTI